MKWFRVTRNGHNNLVEMKDIAEERFIQKRKLLKFEIIIFYIWVFGTEFMLHWVIPDCK